MVGTAPQQRYRRALKLLSRDDYFWSGGGYIRNPVQPIVGTATTIYDRRVVLLLKNDTPTATQNRKAHTNMKIVALVLAGGEGTRLYPLTAEHAKPALAFANGYRIIDFVLSNLVNSKINNIYVLAQYKPASLVAHIENAWAPWFADTQGHVKVLLPRS